MVVALVKWRKLSKLMCQSRICWKHRHHIDCSHLLWKLIWSHYHSRLCREAIHIHRTPSPLNRDRGTLSDIYDYDIAFYYLKPQNCHKPCNWETHNCRSFERVFMLFVLSAISLSHWWRLCKVAKMFVFFSCILVSMAFKQNFG